MLPEHRPRSFSTPKPVVARRAATSLPVASGRRLGAERVGEQVQRASGKIPGQTHMSRWRIPGAHHPMAQNGFGRPLVSLPLAHTPLAHTMHSMKVQFVNAKHCELAETFNEKESFGYQKC